MKKILLFALAVMFIFSMAACAPAKEPEESVSPSVNTEPVNSVSPSPSPEPSLAPALAPSAEPEETGTQEPGGSAPTEKEVEAMLPMMDSILLSGIEGEDENYGSANPEYVFRVLYYLCVNYCGMLPGISVDAQGGTLAISESAATLLASVCFSGFTQMPPFSTDSPSIEYNEELGEYTMLLSDRSESKSVIKNIDWEADATNVTIELVALEDNSCIAAAVFKIVPNSYDTGGQYPFAIQSVELAEE